jgi:hypothetical protein
LAQKQAMFPLCTIQTLTLLQDPLALVVMMVAWSTPTGELTLLPQQLRCR